jgi:hypothetical protein
LHFKEQGCQKCETAAGQIQLSVRAERTFEIEPLRAPLSSFLQLELHTRAFAIKTCTHKRAQHPLREKQWRKEPLLTIFNVAHHQCRVFSLLFSNFCRAAELSFDNNKVESSGEGSPASLLKMM